MSDFLSQDEKKLLIRLYTANLNSHKNTADAQKATIEEFVVQANEKRFKENISKLITDKKVEKLFENIQELVYDLKGDQFANRFNDRHYVEKRFAEVASRLRRTPTLEDMSAIGITRARIRTTHGRIELLSHYAHFNFPTYFEYAVEFAELVNDLRRQQIKRAVAENSLFSVFSITAAPIDPDALATVEKFHEIEGGIPVFIVLTKRIEDIDQSIIDMFLAKKCILVLEDLKINDNLIIKYVNTNEKNLHPASGFRKSDPSISLIIGGITQDVKPLPVKKRGHPRVLFTSGTISTKHHRASINHNKNPHTGPILKAEDNHFLAGWMIEKISEKLFIPTQIMFDQNKEFTVYGRKYSSKSVSVNIPTAHAYADIHEKEHSREVVSHSFHIGRMIKIPKAIFHDIYDCTSGSHWNDGRMMFKAFSFLKGETSWAKELKSLTEFLNIATAIYKMCHIVDSNHDDMALRALDKGSVFKDPENAFLAFLLAPAAIISFFEKESDSEKPIDTICQNLGLDKKALLAKFGYLKDKDPVLKHAVSLFGIENPEKIDWMSLDSSLIIGGYEMSEHGHKGSNGAKGSGMSFSNDFDKAWFGHTHSPFQRNHVLGLGHNVDMTPGRRPKYSIGGTSTWMHADGFIYDSVGTSHHVFTIMGFRSKFLSDAALMQLKNKTLSGLKKASQPNVYEHFKQVA